MAFLIILSCIVFVVVWGYIASEFRHIAAKKGFDEDKYFWWSFLFCIAGWLMVVALPDRGQAPAAAETPDADELPEL